LPPSSQAQTEPFSILIELPFTFAVPVRQEFTRRITHY